MPTRLILIDDHPVVRAGLAAIFELNDDFEVVGSIPGLAELASIDPEVKPDLIISDLALAHSRGIDLLTQPRTDSFTQVPVLIYSASDVIHDVYEAIEAGASGFVIKSASTDTLFYGIRTVMSGGTFVDPSLVGGIVEAQRAKSTRPESISDREDELLRLMAEGLTNREIGARLYLAEKTVKNQLTQTFRRIGVRNRTEAALWARDNLEL